MISAVTGHTEEAYVKKSILCGMNQVLSKPVQIDAMKQLIYLLGYPIESEIKKRQSVINIEEIEVLEQHLVDPNVNKNINLDQNEVREENLD